MQHYFLATHNYNVKPLHPKFQVKFQNLVNKNKLYKMTVNKYV